MDLENLTDREKNGLMDFVKEAVLLSDEENAAIEKQIPMTQKLFEQCLSSLVRIGSISGFNRMFDEFPDQAAVFEQQMEAEEKELAELPELTEEEKEASWNKLVEHIRAKFGENAI